ncbi:MAG: hypothetical protein V4714_20405 [Bacteroidota bacterium]
MKKRSTLLILLLLIQVVTFGQVKLSKNLTVTLGTPYPVIDARSKYYFHQGDEMLSIKITKKEIILQKLNDKKLSFIKVKAYDDMPDNYEVERIFKLGKRYYLFYSLWDKKNEVEQLFSREIDFAKGTFIDAGKRILKIEGKIVSSFTSSSFLDMSVSVTLIDKFSFNASSDSSKILIQSRLKPEIKNDSKSYDIISMNVFNQNLDPVWSKEIKMPYTEKKMNNIDYSIDSEGNAYILTTVYNDNTTDIKKNRNGDANYHIELLRIKANTSTIAITPIEVADKFINKIWLYENPNNYMICAGFYNKGKNLDNADGIILFKVGKEGKAYDVATYEIPVSVLNQYTSKRNQRRNERNEDKDKAEFKDLDLRELIIEKDGSILLIGEQYYVTEYRSASSTGMMSGRVQYIYHYNDMLVTKIDAAGKLAWMKKLPKRQKGGVGIGGMSYQYIRGEDNHYFLFLDNEKNTDLLPDEIPSTHVDGAGGFLTAYAVNNSRGEIIKTSILNTRDVEGIVVAQFWPNKIVPVAASTFVFEAYKKNKEDILIKVTLPK